MKKKEEMKYCLQYIADLSLAFGPNWEVLEI